MKHFNPPGGVKPGESETNMKTIYWKHNGRKYRPVVVNDSILDYVDIVIQMKKAGNEITVILDDDGEIIPPECYDFDEI